VELLKGLGERMLAMVIILAILVVVAFVGHLLGY
jgi:hypothetical protein